MWRGPPGKKRDFFLTLLEEVDLKPFSGWNFPKGKTALLDLKRSSRSWGNSIWATCKGSTGHECVKSTGLFGGFLLLNHWVINYAVVVSTLLYCWNVYEPSSNKERRVERFSFFSAERLHFLNEDSISCILYTSCITSTATCLFFRFGASKF